MYSVRCSEREGRKEGRMYIWRIVDNMDKSHQGPTQRNRKGFWTEKLKEDDQKAEQVSNEPYHHPFTPNRLSYS